ncbi:T9SS type A sorting domain-containing protein [candidate division WOR-3 bacterium]|nr:T9SS type A sorting domain-containing protein [candidate division WOR-3 bacterium]
MRKLIFVLLIFSLTIYAGWSPEIRVTAPDGYMKNWPEIVVDKDGATWVFWHDGGSYDFYYAKWLGDAFSPESALCPIDNSCGSSFGVCLNQHGYPSVAWPSVCYDKKEGSKLLIEDEERIEYDCVAKDNPRSLYGLMRTSFDGTGGTSDTVNSNNVNWYPGIAVNPISGETWISAVKSLRIGWWRWTGIWTTGYVNTGGVWSDHSSIVLEGNNPLVVWDSDMVDANSDTTGEILFSRWTGSGFSPESLITQDTCLDYRPQVKIAPDGTPWLVWFKYLKKYWDGYWAGKWGEIYYSKYTSGSWSTPEIVNTPDTLNDKFPSITFDPSTQNPVVVWCGQDENANYQLYMSAWNGSAWSLEEKITDDTRKSYWPKAAFDSTGHLWAVYQKDYSGDIYTLYSLTKNASLLAITSPPCSLKVDSTYTPEVICANLGDTAEDFYTYFIIYDSLEYVIYSDSFEVLSLMPDSTDTVQFNDWQCSGPGTYTFVSYTSLVGDEYSQDDNQSMDAYGEGTGIEEEGIPLFFNISALSSNPTRNSLDVFYALPKKTDVTFKVYDVAGRIMKRIVRKNQEPGYYHLSLDMRDSPAGIYFINASCGKESQTVKFVVVK